MSTLRCARAGWLLALSLGVCACEEGAAPLTGDARPTDPVGDTNVCELELPGGGPVVRGYEGMVSPDGEGCGVGLCACSDADCNFAFVGGLCTPNSIPNGASADFPRCATSDDCGPNPCLFFAGCDAPRGYCVRVQTSAPDAPRPAEGSPELVWCGCDGVTYEAVNPSYGAYAVAPYAHVGSCEGPR